MATNKEFDWPVKVLVYSTEGSYSAGWPPENGVKLVEWLNEKLDSVPKKYRDKVVVEFSCTPDYDGYTSSLEIYYYIPPDEKEIEKRRNDEKAEAERRFAFAKRSYEEALKRIK